MIGKVLFYDLNRRYGFILYADPDGQPKEMFVHRNQVEGFQDLARDENVEFEIGQYRDRPCAIRVKKLAPATSGVGGSNERK